MLPQDDSIIHIYMHTLSDSNVASQLQYCMCSCTYVYTYLLHRHIMYIHTYVCIHTYVYTSERCLDA